MLRALTVLVVVIALCVEATASTSEEAMKLKIAQAKARAQARSSQKKRDIQPVVQYWHNYATDDGETHFVLCNMTQGWQSVAFGPNQPPIFINAMNLSASVGLTFFYTPAGWNPKTFLHPNPVVQLGVWWQGEELFESSDGTQVLIDHNNLYFGDDVGSKGHHSQNIGEEDAISAMIQFKGPRGKGPCWPSKVPVDKWFEQP